jgi:hypothetical protein
MKKKEEPVDEEILIRTIKQRKKKFTGSRSNENELNITIQNFMNTTMT